MTRRREPQLARFGRREDLGAFLRSIDQEEIMRRILRRIAAGQYDDMGNVTTLAEPGVVEVLIDRHREL